MYKRYESLSAVSPAFTIVELLIVVVVIAILAAITIVSYNGITTRAVESSMKSDLHSAATAVGIDYANTGVYPANAAAGNGGQGLKASAGNVLTYSGSASNFCASITNTKVGSTFYITEGGTIQTGTCPLIIADGSFMQVITNANCPTTRIRAVDARDNKTYWVQKLSDGKCWMLTNLAYTGGGTNTYSDTKTLTDGTGIASTYTAPRYYVLPSGTNVTSEPTAPSTSTDGTGQYGYLYNWCGAMGGQTTAACTSSATPTPDTANTICPAGWRLPTGGTSSEFANLNTALNAGSTSNDSGLLANWLGQRAGYWASVFSAQTYGYYWSSTQTGASAVSLFRFENTGVTLGSSNIKTGGLAVRCIAI